MRPQIISRVAKDVLSVCATARPADAAQWITSLAAHLPVCARTGSLSPG